MSRVLKIDNYIIKEPLINIIKHLKATNNSRKLAQIIEKEDEIILTCVNINHNQGMEKNPDAHINLDPSKAIYGWHHCFACNLSCSFVGFVQHYFESSYDYAKNWLIENYGELASETIIIDDFITLKRQSKLKILDESILEKYQHWTPYLAKRKLDRDICEKFKVRYDPKYRQVIFPIYDFNGKLKMLAKRSIDTKFFHMDADQEKEVYGLNIIQKNSIKTAVICEGPFDCLTSYMYGFPAIATLGTPSLYQITQINKSCLNCLYLCMDNDEAGRKFTEFLKQNLDGRILLIEVFLPKSKKDINDLSKEEYINCINSAK